MSKKKASSTMSLKDFHGGSIPSDLPLPSAPGLMLRSGSDLSASANWGNNIMRTDLRPRPKSSGANRGFDEKASLLSHATQIGRNFDEDERKPLDGTPTSRRPVSDENSRSVLSMRPELKISSHVTVPDRPVSSPVPQSPSIGLNMPARFCGGTSVNVTAKNPNSNSGLVLQYSKASSSNCSQGVNNPLNAWGVRKDVLSTGDVVDSSISSGSSSVSKFSRASALEKVSSGMWQSKNPSQLVPQFVYSKGNSVNHNADVVNEKGDYGIPHGSQVGVGWVLEDGNQDVRRDLSSQGKVASQMYSEEVGIGASSIEFRLASALPSEILQDPKSKQLPKSETLDTSDTSYRQGYQQPIAIGLMEKENDFYGSANPEKPGLNNAKTDIEFIGRLVDRPKLNLKPRSQLLEQSKGNWGTERSSLFGGARPREVVLKERGVGDMMVNNPEQSNLPDRVNSSKNEVISHHMVPTTRHSQKADRPASSRRTGRDLEMRDQRVEHEKANVERRNWRNDKWRSNKDAKEQQPEPETWRKTIEDPKPASADVSGTRHGKLVSALELAQAFSKSVSTSKASDVQRGQRAPGNRNNEVPFSRLTDTREIHSTPSTRPRINGY
ncbi:hypothetical protein K2173_018851 [Erythroxylum novogranatense]|uniref:Uncharacterized protein n=1 Tax=Erythroxylum novogranatense TaxID=1862640 RepID=A0AAV8SAX1_9ROSI|nr:hypothetical protein K2173_018851 [Erythroxylum novogranatense]